MFMSLGNWFIVFIPLGNRIVRGTGSTHDEALRTLREEIESILTEAKRKVNILHISTIFYLSKKENVEHVITTK